MRHRSLVLLLLALVLVQACATSPTGRRQFILIDDAQMAQMGATAFEQVKSSGKVSRDAAAKRYVQCVADALIVTLPEPYRSQPWELAVIADDSANAFALPGGKIGVNTGLLDIATTPDELAAVIGHELAHVISEHAAERVSQQFAADAALQAVQSYSESRGAGQGGLVVGLLGAGAQVGVMLPFSRLHEREADQLGQRYMAEAGFDPRAAVTLWQKMRDASSSRPPKLLATHPDPEDRVRALDGAAPSLEPVAQAARAQGRPPRCARG
jgi:predicted Zn-dependent protease